MDLQKHVVTALQAAKINRDPFPRFFAENVFPADFYADLMAKLAEKTDFHSEKFANRTFADTLDEFPDLAFMKSKRFFKDVLYLFGTDIERQFGGQKLSLTRDLRLIRDQQGYKIGPHTDAPWKVISLLFYLPPTDEFRDYGTSIYIPNDKDFRCQGGPHHPFELFTEVNRVPYIPNSCLGFYKTDNSFHGVAPIPVEIRRDVLLFNIYRDAPPLKE